MNLQESIIVIQLRKMTFLTFSYTPVRIEGIIFQEKIKRTYKHLLKSTIPLTIVI